MKKNKKKKTAQVHVEPQDEGKIVRLHFSDNNLARNLFGSEDRHLRSIEAELGVDIHVRGSDVQVQGKSDDVDIAESILNQLYNMLRRGHPVIDAEVDQAIRAMLRDRNADLEEMLQGSIFLPTRRKVVRPRSVSQKKYLELIRSSDVVFAVGPAGTGKTYLAVVMAVLALLKKEVKRIILMRPAVEAGEKLGFLPGDLQEKVNPYLRPLYDALYDLLEPTRVQELMEEQVIEVAPIAFLRGRTLSSAFVIIDEAQNCNYQQMKMCLTRLGEDSKMVITGDLTQVDLPGGQPSGLVEALRILQGQNRISFHEFFERDVVRHEVVQTIVRAYETDEAKHKHA